MKTSHLSVFALLAVVALPLAAAPPKAPPKAPKAPLQAVIEATAENVVLPSGTDGILVYRECKGCPAKSLRTSAATVYHFNQLPVTLPELRATLTQLPSTNINIVVSGKTRELISLDAVNEQAIGAPRTKNK